MLALTLYSYSLMKKISLLTGGAGFIGVNLIEKLLQEERHVVVVDNMSRGSYQNIHNIYGVNNKNISIFNTDCSHRSDLSSIFSFSKNLGNFDEVWHLAANSDIPGGVENSDVDFKDTFLTTYEILQAMKSFEVGKLNFASSSAIYGDLGFHLLHEDVGPLLPISNYGAMKLASEACASASAESHLSNVNLFRFPNVVGVPATHGVILDFIQKLLISPGELHVLGDGTQQKSYLHVSDLIGAMLAVRKESKEKLQYINIGPVDDGVTVSWIAEQVVSRISPWASIVYGIGNKGWVGDVPKFSYSTTKLQNLGWAPKLNSREAVSRAIDEVAIQLGR